MSSHWLVAHTHVHSEDKAAFNLKRQGFDTYLPRYAKRRKHARKIEVVRVPLFPRYIFVSLGSAAGRWRSIRSTFGVSRLVTFGEAPALLADHVVESMRSCEVEGFIARPHPSFSTGDRVRIRDGAFADCMGLVQGMRDEDRVFILLDLLGQQVRVVLDGLQLERV